VRLDYGGGTTEVVTSRSTRRIEGNHLHKADKSVWSGGVHTYRYDALGNISQYADALGNAWRHERDEQGRLLSTIDPLGGKTEYRYDERGRIIEMCDALGGVARYERDAAGDVLSVYDDLGLVVAFGYDERGLLVHGTLPNGGVTRMEYDALCNRITVIEPDGGTRRIRHDFLGRILGFVDERGLDFSYTYDDCGRLQSVRRPSGSLERYEYDPDGRLARIIDADGRSTALRWGGVGVVTELIRADGQVVRYRYDREQDLVRVINELGEEHRFKRSGEGRIVEERTFDGRAITYRHDFMGQITSIKEGTRTIDFKYDACGRLVERSYTDGRKDVIERDLLGRVVCVSTGDTSCTYAYDARGRVMRETVTLGGRSTVVETAYDALGNAVSATGPFGVMEIGRDIVGRPVEVAFGDVAPLGLTYDAAGRLVERRLAGGGRVVAGTTEDGRPAWVQVLSPKAAPRVGAGEPEWIGENPLGVSFWRSHGWSPAGLLASIGGPSGEDGPTELPRDANGRVRERKRVQGARQTTLEAFGYGPSGDLYEPSTRRSYGPGGRLLGHGDATYTYDEHGRMTQRRAPGGKAWHFAWGDDDLLAAIETPEGRTVRFAYDPFVRRIEKRVECGGRMESVTRYAWQGDALVHEIRERAAAAGDPLVLVEERTYAVVPGSVLPLAHKERRRDEGAEIRYYVESPNGAPEALVASDGTLVGALEPSLFGRVTGEAAALTPLRFPGQYADEETGLHYNRYRYYDPETGQYLSPEPLRIAGSLKAYAYVDGWPTELVDIDGLKKMHTDVAGSYEKKNKKQADVTKSANSQSRPTSDLHPAVQAALPPTPGREKGNGGDPQDCSEPKALSDYLKQWESDTGRSCNPDDPKWQTNLQDALNSIDSVKSYKGNNKNKLEQACPNCSQTLPRLWALAGLDPPDSKVPGGATSISDPEQNKTGPDYPSGWKDKADRGQSPTTKGAYKDATGNPVEPGAWNWDGAKWERI